MGEENFIEFCERILNVNLSPMQRKYIIELNQSLLPNRLK